MSEARRIGEFVDIFSLPRYGDIFFHINSN